MKTNLEEPIKCLTVPVPGDLTSTTAGALRESLADLLDENRTAAVPWESLRIDLSAATMVDSVGLNLVVSILRAVQKHKARLLISYSNPNVLRTFQFTRLDRHLTLELSPAPHP